MMKQVAFLFAMVGWSASFALTPLGSDSSLPSVDRTFMSEAEASGQMEIELGNIALHKAADEHVRRFAQRMLEDRSRISNELVQAAKGQGVALSPEVKPYQRDTVDWISKLNGGDFDREYMQLAVMDQKSMAEEFKHEASEGEVPELKSVARKALPTMRDDLSVANRFEMRIASSMRG